MNHDIRVRTARIGRVRVPCISLTSAPSCSPKPSPIAFENCRSMRFCGPTKIDIPRQSILDIIIMDASDLLQLQTHAAHQHRAPHTQIAPEVSPCATGSPDSSPLSLPIRPGVSVEYSPCKPSSSASNVVSHSNGSFYCRRCSTTVGHHT